MSTLDVHVAVTVRSRQRNPLQAYQHLTHHSRQALKQREEFLALLAHELFTPLTCILGWSQLAPESDDISRLRMAFDVIERNAHRQKEIIEALLRSLRGIGGTVIGSISRQQVLWNYGDGVDITGARKTCRQLSLPLEMP